MSNLPTRTIGLPWFMKEDYPGILSIMEDSDVLPRTWNKWLMDVEQVEKKLRREGIITIKAYIDPVTFPYWCRVNGLNVDAKARMAYAKAVACEVSRNIY